jgi:soluble lytic murein transglycosylase-like protein
MSALLKITKSPSWMFAAVAIAAILALAPRSAAPGRMDNAAACAPEATLPSGEAPKPEGTDDPARRAMVEYLARRFSIAAAPTATVVETAYSAAELAGLDPLLVLAVISIESRFNPIAESVMGAKGLMQIIPRYHLARLNQHGGEDAVLDPQSNILVGTQILQEYVYRTGTLEAGLQFYNGASRDPSLQYAQRVLAERERFEQALRAALSPRTAALSTKGAL